MSHHSEDYKETAVKHYLEGKDDMRDTCKLFKCKYQSLSRWVKQYNKYGNVNRKTRKNRNLKITPKIETFVKNYVRKYNTTTLWELSRLVKEEFNIHLNDKSIHNILSKNKITRKRLRSKYYPEKREGQEQQDLDTFYNTLNTKYDYSKTICMDESSIYLNMTLTYGRSKSGTRVLKKTNKYPYKRFNLLCAISADKVVAWKLYPQRIGGIKTVDILEFYNDNISKKYKKLIREKIEEDHNKLLYTVPYHPETNAIEEFFSQLKHYIKKESPNTYEDIVDVLTDIMDKKITKVHLTNYLKHSYKIYNS
jgi:transposase